MRNNIETIAVNYCSLSKNLNYHANILMQFISNLDKKTFINFINIGAGCLLLRKMIDLSDNYKI
jgi:hypothetical protein